MSKQELLNNSLFSTNAAIQFFLKERITRPYASVEHLGNFIWTLVDMYRGRAILRFLLEADVNGFFEDLHRDALTYLTLLKAYHQGFDVVKSRINGETEGPLVCAMAAGNFGLAREIDALMPHEPEEPEGQYYFTYTTLLRALAVGDEQAISQAFQTFESTCTGQFNFDVKIAVLKPLVHKDIEAFNDALLEYLESFEQLTLEELEELNPGDDDIDVTALALVQVARRRGVPLTVAHRMLPPELLEPRDRIPHDGYPTWP